MSDAVKWAILGAGKFAREQMGPAIHMARGNELSVLATRSKQKAEPFTDIVPGLRVLDTYEAVLNDASIDAVYVPLPNHLHLEWAQKCLEAGKHVLVEKPVAMSVAEVDRLIETRDRTGLLAAEGFMIVHHPQWQKLRTMVLSGNFGALRHVSAVFTYDNRSDMQNIRNRPETGGGGLRDIGVYLIGGARYASGAEPTHVSGRLDFENGIDTRAVITAQFPGFTFDGLVSTRMSRRQEMVFHMEHAVIRLTAPFNPLMYSHAEIHVEGPGMQTCTERFPGVNQYVLQVEAFAASVLIGAKYPCDLEFVRGTQSVLDELLSQPG